MVGGGCMCCHLLPFNDGVHTVLECLHLWPARNSGGICDNISCMQALDMASCGMGEVFLHLLLPMQQGSRGWRRMLVSCALDAVWGAGA